MRIMLSDALLRRSFQNTLTNRSHGQDLGRGEFSSVTCLLYEQVHENYNKMSSAQGKTYTNYTVLEGSL